MDSKVKKITDVLMTSKGLRVLQKVQNKTLNRLASLKNKDEINVGVVGYSDKKFDIDKAKELIIKAFDQVENRFPEKKFICISGLTDLGIPSLAYKEAVGRGWKTIGVACERAKEYDLFDVDESIIIGEEWGDESEEFLSMLDVLIRIGGGEQSHKEVKAAKGVGILVLEFELAKE